MIKRVLSCILFLGVIPCDTAAFTLFRNPELGKKIALFFNLLVCLIVAISFSKNLKKRFFYEKISTKYLTYFVFLIIFNIIGANSANETALLGHRIMSMVCLCAYYIYGLYIFNDADSMVKSLNITLLILIILSAILYRIDYLNATYIADATTRFFKGVSLNRNSYAEISLFYIASNIYLWSKNKNRIIYYSITTGIAIYTTYLTNSATAIICSLLLLFLSLLYMVTKRVIPFRLVLVGYLFLFISLIVIQSENTPFLSEILKYFNKDSNLTGRTDIWKTSMELISEYFIFGRGFDTEALIENGVYINDPHNGILYMMLTQGIVGTVVFIVMFYKVIVKAMRLLKDNVLFAYMYNFIIVWIIRGFTESVFAYSHYVFWIAIIIIEMLIIEKEKQLIDGEILHEK